MRRPACVFLLLAGAPLLFGCTPSIGDECASSIDCSQQGDRLCDTNQPGGYCTIFNCEPDTCPEDESVCVAFDNVLDPACGPGNDTDWPRFGRTFCMAVCEDNGDCRDGYECALPPDMTIIDTADKRAGDKFCLNKAPAPPASSGTPPEICDPVVPDGGKLDGALQGSSSAGGAGGVGGGGGQGGAGGLGGGGQGGMGGAGGLGGAGGTGG